MGNRVTSMLTTLATDVDDPRERLQAIHDRMVQAKEQQEAIGADTLSDWAEFAAPALAGRAARLYSRMKMADRHRPIFNVTISNVPGPPFPLYSVGARLVANYPVGPIIDGGGLNMTVMSYLDQLDFGLLACPDVLPDIWALADGLHTALDELAAAYGVTEDDAAKLSRISLTRRARARRRSAARSRTSRRLLAYLRPGPEEAAQAVLRVAWHDVAVEVRHALADPVVHRHERARRAEAVDAPRRRRAAPREVGADQLGGQVGQRLDVVARDDQHVAREQRPDVEEPERHGVVEHDVGRPRPATISQNTHGPAGMEASVGFAGVHVSMLITCVVDVFQPDVGAAAVAVLRAAGCEVRVQPRPDVLRAARLERGVRRRGRDGSRARP